MRQPNSASYRIHIPTCICNAAQLLKINHLHRASNSAANLGHGSNPALTTGRTCAKTVTWAIHQHSPAQLRRLPTGIGSGCSSFGASYPESKGLHELIVEPTPCTQAPHTRDSIRQHPTLYRSCCRPTMRVKWPSFSSALLGSPFMVYPAKGSRHTLVSCPTIQNHAAKKHMTPYTGRQGTMQITTCKIKSAS